MQFVKLFNSILDSTIWQESKETKLIWITMMAMSDRNGEIHASIPGLASRTGVTLAECEAALTCLLSPDAYSRTKTDEGRRIAVIDGGWRLLNHGKYRALLSAEERKEYNRVKQQQHRAALKNVNDRSMTISNVSTVQSQSQSQSQSTESEEEPLTESAPPPPLDGTLKLEPEIPKPAKIKKPKADPPDPRRNDFLEIFREFYEHSTGRTWAGTDAADNTQLKRFFARQPEATAEDWREYLIYISEASQKAYAESPLKGVGTIAIACSRWDRLQVLYSQTYQEPKK